MKGSQPLCPLITLQQHSKLTEFFAIQVGRDVTERAQRAVGIGSAFPDGNAQK